MLNRLFRYCSIICVTTIFFSLSVYAETPYVALEGHFEPIYWQASIGKTDRFNALMFYQKTSIGGVGSSNNIFFSASIPVTQRRLFTGIKWGLFHFGKVKQHVIELQWAYQLSIGKTSLLLLGLGLGVKNLTSNFEGVIIQEKNDPFLSKNISIYQLETGLSGYYTLSKLSVGFAYKYISNSSLGESEVSVRGDNEWHGIIKWNSKNDFLQTISWEDPENQTIQVNPYISFHHMTNLTYGALHFDLKFRAYLLGISYQTQRAVGVKLGLTLGTLSLFYNYSPSIGGSAVGVRTHEMMLRLKL